MFKNKDQSLLGSRVTIIVALLLVVALPWIGSVGVANAATADSFGLWLGFFGRFHPTILHLPIGVIVYVFVVEVASAVTRGRIEAKTNFALWFAALAAVLSCVLGYFLYLTGEYPTGELIEEHKRDGILFTVLLLLALLVKLQSRGRAGKWLLAYRVLLILTFATMLSAGHHGGEITHGEPSDAWPPKVLADREITALRNAQPDRLVYEEMIQPILEAKCVKCHGEKKQKSGLRVDTVAFMLEGGEETACLVPGNVKESSLIGYLHLPEDDDLRMPPEGKTQLTAQEIKLLEWWVRIGAPVGKRESEVASAP